MLFIYLFIFYVVLEIKLRSSDLQGWYWMKNHLLSPGLFLTAYESVTPHKMLKSQETLENRHEQLHPNWYKPWIPVAQPESSAVGRACPHVGCLLHRA